MTDILSKPIDQITRADIESLVTSGVPEGERMEFKRELPAERKGKKDPWMDDQRKIARYAQNKILKGVVSFANAYGGVLVLGIEEDGKAQPAVAKNIYPIPKCEDLAGRFRKIFRDCVEPKLPSCDIFAVDTGGEGAGVVVFRVPGRSRLAPHRITKTWICPIRRWDRSEDMTMREIQDMTLNVARGHERLDKKLQEREEKFKNEFKRLSTPECAYGVRITAVPVGDDLRLQRICGPWGKLVEGLSTPGVTVARHIPGTSTTIEELRCQRYHDVGYTLWTPQLRAARSRSLYEHLPNVTPTHDAYLELHCDGLVEFGWVEVIEDTNKVPLFLNDFVLVLANVICWVHALRRYAGAGQVEYAVQIAVHVENEKLFVVPAMNSDTHISHPLDRFAGQLSSGLTMMPTYTLFEISEAEEILSTFEHDLCNAGGKALQDDVLGKFKIKCE